MEKYLKFIEQYSAGHRYFWRAGCVYKKKSAEIFLNRENGAGWQIKFDGEGDFTTCDVTKLVEILGDSKIDFFALQGEVIGSIKTMLVFSNLLQKDAKILLGENAVEEAVSEFDEFANKLTNLVQDLLEKKNEPATEAKDLVVPKLQLIKTKEFPI